MPAGVGSKAALSRKNQLSEHLISYVSVLCKQERERKPSSVLGNKSPTQTRASCLGPVGIVARLLE